MRHLVLSALVAVTAVAGVAQAADPGPERGFRDLSWGDAPTGDMYEVEMTIGGMQAYLRRGSDGSVGGKVPAFIAFLFYQRRFCRVEVGWESVNPAADLLALTRMLSTGWGQPDATTTTSRLWRSKASDTLARLGIEKQGSGGRMAEIALTIFDAPCTREAAALPGGVLD
jgi:hypothetical protein